METLVAHKDDKIRGSELDWLVNCKSNKDNIPDWKNCKLLGSKLDTETDINRRKVLSMKSKEDAYKSKRISLSLKARSFEVFSVSIFLYNSELWTVTKTTEKKIDSFQRRLRRQVINIKWPKEISNDYLYIITNTEKWSTQIKRRRLNWLGHMMRLTQDTPARQSLNEALSQPKRKVGKQPLTWIKHVEQDLQPIIQLEFNTNIVETSIQRLEAITEDRNKWKQLIKNIMVGNN